MSKYNFIGTSYSSECPATKVFKDRVRNIVRRDKTENEQHIDNGFIQFGHDFTFFGTKYMIDYRYYYWGYYANVYPCNESVCHDLRVW